MSLIRSVIGGFRRGYTCLFIPSVQRQNTNIRNCHKFPTDEPSSTIQQKSTDGIVEEEILDFLNDEEFFARYTDEDSITKDQSASNILDLSKSTELFPNATHMDMLVDGVPFKDIPIVNIKATSNNTLMALVKDNKVVTCSTGGSVGFKNKNKSSTVAAQTVGFDIAQKALFHNIKNVRICVRGFSQGRLPAIKALETAGLNIVSITDTTRLAFNGCKPRKARRM
ncbi:30S ribosomal protein S11-like [Mytilus californianus]|uniref:30S ribosomal protein S11-like n=1 Tax=Mytilus californianus TaxID=6549 RepID=UPI00224545D4|nr:30S ribosomal protein S11-like [Mytilus californianus]XP_052102062.1 30S ribosomal protein S11-like [Mytilus californianus]